MYRYLALISQGSRESSSFSRALFKDRVAGERPSWTFAFESDDVLIACRQSSDPAEGFIDLSGAGLIVGTIFESGNDAEYRRSSYFTADQAAAIRSSSGRVLICEYWGSYVMFLVCADRQVRVLRGPMSMLPCFHTRLGDCHLFFSNVADCRLLGIASFTISWDSICAQVIGADCLTSETALNEVSALQVGECNAIRGNQLVKESYWNPATIAATGADVLGFDAAADSIRRTTMKCVRAWARPHSAILLQLSGGFDSSVVLTALKDMYARPEVTCVTFFSRGPGNELQYARAMAAHANCPLMEINRNSHVDLGSFLRCKYTVRPILNFSAPATDALDADLAQAKGATTVFTGELGDNLFGQGLRAEAVREYFFRHGMRMGLIGTALDAAQLARASFWKTLLLGVCGPLPHASGTHWSIYEFAKSRGVSSLASEETLMRHRASMPRFIHEWCRDVSAVPPGLFMLFLGLIVITSPCFDSPFSTDDQTLLGAPLASQPLVEVVLRMPSYLHIRRGLDRAVARHAFARDLPSLVLERGPSKGTPLLWVRDVVEKNRKFLREILLDGLLVRNGILDRTKLEALLSGEVNKSANMVSDIFEQLYIEAWCRQWHGERMTAAR